MKILVCGCRHWNDDVRVFTVLDRLHQKHGRFTLIHGAAKGADSLSERWARTKDVEIIAYPAKWSEHGSKAGPMRNAAMLHERPNLCVAFWDGISPGTGDMIRKAVRERVQVLVIPM
jgi:hypothetical protein